MKTTAPVDQLAGVSQQVKAMLNNYKTEMIPKGMDPTVLLAGADAKIASMNAKNQEQEAAHTAWKERTDELAPLKDDVYADIAQGCDMVITAFGRTSPRGQEATALRRQITGRSGGGGTPPAPQPPAP
ncbi:MAG: hypothetical protein HZC54_08175 [Verrucomicrobia bacterium]|nr:hypothetical protein [Verrucomicrobiota bacterium]